jgi:hypothetical protein
MRVPQRFAQVYGEWHLWIYMCAWSLSWRDREIAHSESADLEMNRALSLLNGQSLIAVTAGGADGRSSLRSTSVRIGDSPERAPRRRRWRCRGGMDVLSAIRQRPQALR